ncbi:MAG: acyltransferase [Acidimicrobiales bacterium]
MTTASTARDASEATGPARPGGYFPGFEVLRAIAAAMVVVHHADNLAGGARSGLAHELAAVGDSGVAVFFVLSGFLIYRPFAAAHLAGRRAQRAVAFWWRRLLRIVPAYWVVLTTFWALGSFRLGGDWWRYYLFLQSYSRETALGGVVQAWSLCTEMSFYLLVPAFAGLLARLGGSGLRARVGVQLGAIAVLFASAFVAREAIERVAPSYRGLSFQWLPMNLDLFASGMALAVVSAWAAHDDRLRSRLDALARWAEPWWLAAFALFAWYAVAVGPAASFEVGYVGWFWQRRQLVLAVMTLLLLVPAVFGPSERRGLRAVWSIRPLAWVGTVSYGLYLWHFDWMKRAIPHVDPFGATSWAGWFRSPELVASVPLLLAVGFGVGLVFAAASWYLLEQPLQRFKGLLDPARPHRAAAEPEGASTASGALGGPGRAR